MSPSPMFAIAGVLLVLGASDAQFLQPLVASPDPSLALQPPPLHQGGFATFAAQPVAHAVAQPQTVTQTFLQPPPALQAVQPLPMLRQQQQQQQLAHHAVVQTAEDEARLPDELRNNFYKNPRIAEGLAKQSWFIPGEEQVLEREAEKIPREQIFKLLKNAGLARRR